MSRLFLLFLGLCVVDRMRQASGSQERAEMSVGLVVLFVAISFVRCDYGAKALGCAIAMYLLRESEALRAVAASSCLGSPFFALFAFIPIGFYNGERGFIKGRALQMLFYAIYPAHMLLLWYIRLRTVGY